MADTSQSQSPGKLFRCGVCSCDFPTLNACIAHMKHHAAETLMASKPDPPPPASTLQLQTTSMASPERKSVISALNPARPSPLQSPVNVFSPSHLRQKSLIAVQNPVGSAGGVPAPPATSYAGTVGSVEVKGPSQSQIRNLSHLLQTPVAAQQNIACVQQNTTAGQQSCTATQQDGAAAEQYRNAVDALQRAAAKVTKSVLDQLISNGEPPVSAITCPGDGKLMPKSSAAAVSSAQGRPASNVSLLLNPSSAANYAASTNTANVPKPPTITVNKKNYKLVPFPAAAIKGAVSKDPSAIMTNTAAVTQTPVISKTSSSTNVGVAAAVNGTQLHNTAPSSQDSSMVTAAAMQTPTIPVTQNVKESATAPYSITQAETKSGESVAATPTSTSSSPTQTSERKAILVHSHIFETVPVVKPGSVPKPEVADTTPSIYPIIEDISTESETANEGESEDVSHVADMQVKQEVSINENGERKVITLPEVKLKRWASLAREKPHECPEPGCGARYRFISSLSIHKKRHSGERPYECKLCQKRFWHPTNLRVHQRTHSGVRRYECGECGHGFNQLHDLRIHMTIHTGELPLKCPVEDCSRAFRDPSCYRRHMSRHAGVQPHLACDKCEARFYHHSALNRHYRKHTGEKDYVCDVCGAAFARADTLKLHQRSHSGQKPYSCSACHLQFADRSYCRRHTAKHPPEDNAVILANLAPSPMIKQEQPSHENGYEENHSSGGMKPDGNGRPRKRGSTIVPVQIPNPPGSDVPYASIEIEIPESDLQDGESGDVMYQYGDMLITISRAAVDMEKDVAEVDSVADLLQGETPMEAAPAPFYETEHKYSRAMDTRVLQNKHSAAGGTTTSQMTEHSSAVMTHPQPLSEYNEIVSAVLESGFIESKVKDEATTVSTKKQKSPRVGERRWPCKDCNASFFHQAELKRHRTKHTGEMPYQCHICFKRVRDPSNLKRHVRTHTGDRPYKCDTCKKKFSQAGHLSAHMRIHTGERPYKCDLCPSRFVEANHLRYHKKMHAGIKDFKCNECELRFIRNAELKRHMKVHSGIRPFQCDQCPSSYFRQDALKLHRVLKHQERRVKPFPCPKCTLSFSKQVYLDRHLEKVKHPVDSVVSQGDKKKESKENSIADGNKKNGGDKSVNSVADTKNSVAVDALCELATGVRSTVVSIEGGSVVTISELVNRSSEAKTANSFDPKKGKDSPSPAMVKALARVLTEKRDDAKKSDNPLPMEDGDLSVGRDADEIFVKKVMVEGGTVMGTEARKVQSDQAMEVTDVASGDNHGLATYHTLGEEGFGSPTVSKMIVVDTSRGETFQVDSLSKKKQAGVEEKGEGKDKEKSSFITIEVPKEVASSSSSQVPRQKSNLRQSDRPISIIRVDNGIISTTSLSTETTTSSSVLAKTQSNPTSPLIVSTAQPTIRQPVSSPETLQAKAPTSGKKPVARHVSRQAFCSGGVSANTQPASDSDSSLASTLQLILTGKVELEKVEPVKQASGARRRGRPAGSKMIKEEPESDGETVGQHPPIGGPIRTRSGRERKIKQKYSA